MESIITNGYVCTHTYMRTYTRTFAYICAQMHAPTFLHLAQIFMYISSCLFQETLG